MFAVCAIYQSFINGSVDGGDTLQIKVIKYILNQ